MQTIIELDKMEFYAFHGCYREEQVVGNQFLVNLKLEVADTDAVHSDKLSDALNYQKAYEIVKVQMSLPSHLLEHVSGRILDALFEEFPQLISASVKVSKLFPPIGGKMEKVSVELTKAR